MCVLILHFSGTALHQLSPRPCCARLCCRSPSQLCLHFLSVPCGITLFPFPFVFLLPTTGHTHLSFILYSSDALKYFRYPHPVVSLLFPWGPLGPSLSLFFPLFDCRSLSFHPSFSHLNLSQDDLGRAHLLSSPSASIPPETSVAQFLSQNSPGSSLLARSITHSINSSSASIFSPFTLGCPPYFPSILLIIPAPFFIFPILSAIW